MNGKFASRKGDEAVMPTKNIYETGKFANELSRVSGCTTPSLTRETNITISKIRLSEYHTFLMRYLCGLPEESYILLLRSTEVL